MNQATDYKLLYTDAKENLAAVMAEIQKKTDRVRAIQASISALEALIQSSTAAHAEAVERFAKSGKGSLESGKSLEIAANQAEIQDLRQVLFILNGEISGPLETERQRLERLSDQHAISILKQELEKICRSIADRIESELSRAWNLGHVPISPYAGLQMSWEELQRLILPTRNWPKDYAAIQQLKNEILGG